VISGLTEDELVKLTTCVKAWQNISALIVRNSPSVFIGNAGNSSALNPFSVDFRLFPDITTETVSDSILIDPAGNDPINPDRV